jgi:hypothetical protein
MTVVKTELNPEQNQKVELLRARMKFKTKGEAIALIINGYEIFIRM